MIVQASGVSTPAICTVNVQLFPTPGGVGGYHAAVQFALTDVFRVPVATATGVALIAHAVSFVPVSLVGFAWLAVKPVRKGDAIREDKGLEA